MIRNYKISGKFYWPVTGPGAIKGWYIPVPLVMVAWFLSTGIHYMRLWITGAQRTRAITLAIFVSTRIIGSAARTTSLTRLHWRKSSKVKGTEMVSFCINTLKPRRNVQHFTDDIFKRIFINENVWILIKISLKFVSKGPINNIPALVQIMAWRRPGDKPLCVPMIVSLLMHICITRPQWDKIMIIYHSP